MKHARLLTAALLASLLMTASACGDDSAASSKTTDPVDGDTTAAITEDPFIASLPDDLDFGGMEVCIARCTAFSENEKKNEVAPDAELTKGEIVDDAVRLRNTYVEDLLNVNITSPDDELGVWTDFPSTIQPLIMAGDTTYDAYVAATWGLFKSSLNGLLLPLSDIDTLDFGNPWWDSELIEMFSLGSNSTYFAAGAINYYDDYATTALLINTKLCSQNDLELPYQMVLDGKWTIDRFCEYAKAYAADVNGDSVYDENDAYGLICNIGIPYKFTCGAGESFILIDDNGFATLNQSERLFNVVDKLFTNILDRNNNAICVVERKLGYDIGNALFPNGQSLFYVDMVGGIDAMRRKMEDNFGIIPIPKYDEEQENYYSVFDTAYGTAYAIPVTQEAPETIGRVLEVMGFYSQNTIYPAVIEKNILVKGIRDEESGKMLDLIFKNKFYELGQWGSYVYDEMMSMCSGGVNKFASKAASITKRTEKEFAAIAEYYNYD